MPNTTGRLCSAAATQRDLRCRSRCRSSVVAPAAEFQPRGGIRHRPTRQVDANEVARRLAALGRGFVRLISQPMPLLQQAHLQNVGHAHRPATHALPRWVRCLDHLNPLRLRHHLLHLGKKPLAACALLIQGEFSAGQTASAHDRCCHVLDAFTRAYRVPEMGGLISVSLGAIRRIGSTQDVRNHS
jgi:hypothetical protein